MLSIAVFPVDESCYVRSFRPRTGRHQFVRWLLEELSTRADVRLTVFTEHAQLPGRPLEVEILPMSGLHEWESVNRDYVIFQPESPYWWYPALVRSQLKLDAPIVSMIHGLHQGRGVTFLLASLASRSMVGDSVVSPSVVAGQVFRRQVEQLNGMSGQRAVTPRLEIAPYGAPRPSRQIERSAARRTLDIEEGSVCLLYVGRLDVDRKADLNGLIRVWQRIARTKPRTQLVLAGATRPGTKPPACVDPRVHVYPDFSPELADVFYAACDIVVSPANSASESFGIVPVEAMAHGRPIVASDWSGYREVVIDAVTGVLVPTTWERRGGTTTTTTSSTTTGRLFGPEGVTQTAGIGEQSLYEAITRLVDDLGMREAMGVQAKLRYEQYSIERAADRILRVFRESRLSYSSTTQGGYAPMEPIDRAFELYASEVLSVDQ